MHVLAHRGNLRGPNMVVENSIGAYGEALAAGFGLEIDVRRSEDGNYYISHDLRNETSELLLDRYRTLFDQYSEACIAVNIKELGYEGALASCVQAGWFGRHAFLFDFELLEPQAPGRGQRDLRQDSRYCSVRLASRLSDRSENLDQALSIPGEIVWADEFDSLWLTEEHVKAVHRAGRAFYAISPELHGFGKDVCLSRWKDFARWGIDGICTDFAFEARSFFRQRNGQDS